MYRVKPVVVPEGYMTAEKLCEVVDSSISQFYRDKPHMTLKMGKFGGKKLYYHKSSIKTWLARLNHFQLIEG